MVQPLWRTVLRFLKKLKIKPPYVPAISFLGMCLEKIIIPKDTCTPVFTAALLIIARTWKQTSYVWTNGRIKKMCYIYTTE